MYKMELKPGLFIITVSGFIKEDEANSFISEYNLYVKKINPSQTDLILDGKNLATSAQNMLPILEGCLKMYIKDNFRKIFLTKFESTITMMQIKKLNASQFLDRIIMIDSVEDAMLQLKV
ncbi:MAG: hypothetical protein Q8942_18165 [Bacillota bacterium]|nr:hypothetical protein [Bacillota bacterium]